MATYFIRNSLNPNKVVKLSVTLKQVASKDQKGELVWVAEVKTLEGDKDGGPIAPYYLHLTSLSNLDEELKRLSASISERVDWGSLLDDNRSPFVSSCSPSSYEDNSIDCGVTVIIEDGLPSSGIDINSITMKINDMDVTSEVIIEGNPYKYKLIWNPFMRVYDTYE